MIPGECYEISADQLISAEHSLQHAVALTNRSKLIRAITLQANPYLNGLSLRLAALLTHEYPDPEGGILLANSISEAADAYAQSAERGGRMEENEYEYTSALLQRAARLADYTVHGVAKSHSERWLPFAGTLFAWHGTRSYQTIVFTKKKTSKVEHHATMVFLAGHLLTFERAELITRLIPHTTECACNVD